NILQSTPRSTSTGWLLLAVWFLATLHVRQLDAFPSSLSDCQTPTGWNCSGYDDRDTDLFLCDTNTCKFDGECLRIGDTVTCICDFKCNNDYVPVCGSNNENYQNECYLRKDACKLQTEVLVASEGACPVGRSSSRPPDVLRHGFRRNPFGAECDEDAEDVWCVCNIDCSQISFNPVCASDGKSYDNPCQVKEASCQKQERIEVKYLGHCQGEASAVSLSVTPTYYAVTDWPSVEPDRPSEGTPEYYIPCPEHYKNYCVHGDYSGPQECDNKDYNVLYVVPGSGKLRYVLIASIIGAVQVAVICVVVLCITRKCPRGSRITRQKQNATHYGSENTMRASTRLI
uniref:Transmembrane protein with EGF-like and two follistatin-like domains 2a n=1 Tax=Paramormyrops kingsleyae TaxID=1676925 RepID=A0A3B3SM61_9TELE